MKIYIGPRVETLLAVALGASIAFGIIYCWKVLGHG